MNISVPSHLRHHLIAVYEFKLNALKREIQHHVTRGNKIKADKARAEYKLLYDLLGHAQVEYSQVK